jgi:TonB family protein
MGFSGPQQYLFSSLPKWKVPWSDFVLSYGTQALTVAILVWVPILHPQILEAPKRDYHAIALVATPVPINRAPQRQLPKPVLVAELDPPRATLRLPAPRPRPKAAQDTPAPEVKLAVRKLDPLPASTAPIIPKQLVRTNVFSTGSSAPQTIERPAQQVQTGGFGDPNGVPAKATQTRAVNVAQAGAFDLPTGSDYGNGRGGENGARGVVASAGFGGGVATTQAHSASLGTVHQAGFGDADLSVPPTVQARLAVPSAARVIPVEILSKPTPLYTSEARAKRIEGEVLLEVVFEAAGKVRVVRVIRGLGYGLDDAAVSAAEQIRFRPALQDGQPSDSTTVLHIVFQIA